MSRPSSGATPSLREVGQRLLKQSEAAPYTNLGTAYRAYQRWADANFDKASSLACLTGREARQLMAKVAPVPAGRSRRGPSSYLCWIPRPFPLKGLGYGRLGSKINPSPPQPQGAEGFFPIVTDWTSGQVGYRRVEKAFHHCRRTFKWGGHRKISGGRWAHWPQGVQGVLWFLLEPKGAYFDGT